MSDTEALLMGIYGGICLLLGVALGNVLNG